MAFPASPYEGDDPDVTDSLGLYFLELPWLHTAGFWLLFGVGGDAKYVTDHILNHLEHPPPEHMISLSWPVRSAGTKRGPTYQESWSGKNASVTVSGEV